MNKVRHIDILVIGAGPAGSVFGYLALKAGLDCLLADFATFPREKICGGGLTPKAWRLLDKLVPGIKYDYHPVRHMRFQLDDSPMCEFEAEQEIRMTNRKDFDYTLLQYYQQAGGELLKDAFLGFEQQHDGRFLVTITQLFVYVIMGSLSEEIHIIFRNKNFCSYRSRRSLIKVRGRLLCP